MDGRISLIGLLCLQYSVCVVCCRWLYLSANYVHFRTEKLVTVVGRQRGVTPEAKNSFGESPTVEI